MISVLFIALGILSGLALFLVVLLLFKQYRRYTMILSDTDAKLAEIKQSVDPWLSMRFGRIYVYPRKFESNVALQKFTAMLDMGFKGFWISPTNLDNNMRASQRKHVKTGIRLSMAHGNDTISPSKLDFLLKRIMEFSTDITNRKADGVVLISGLDSMYRRNGAERVRNFLTHISQDISKMRVMVLIDLNQKRLPQVLSKWVLEKLPQVDDKKMNKDTKVNVKVKRPVD